MSIPYPTVQFAAPRVRTKIDLSTTDGNDVVKLMREAMVRYGSWTAVGYRATSIIFCEVVPIGGYPSPTPRIAIFDDYLRVGPYPTVLKYYDPRIDTPTPALHVIWMKKGIPASGSPADLHNAAIESLVNLCLALIATGEFFDAIIVDDSHVKVFALKTGPEEIFLDGTGSVSLASPTSGGGYGFTSALANGTVTVVALGSNDRHIDFYIELGQHSATPDKVHYVMDGIIQFAGEWFLYDSPYQFLFTPSTPNAKGLYAEVPYCYGNQMVNYLAYFLPDSNLRLRLTSTDAYVAAQTDGNTIPGEHLLYSSAPSNRECGWNYMALKGYKGFVFTMGGGPVLQKQHEGNATFAPLYSVAYLGLSLAGDGSVCQVVASPWNCFYRTGAVAPWNTMLNDPDDGDVNWLSLHTNQGTTEDTEAVIWCRCPKLTQITDEDIDLDYLVFALAQSHDSAIYMSIPPGLIIKSEADLDIPDASGLGVYVP